MLRACSARNILKFTFLLEMAEQLRAISLIEDKPE